MTSKFYQKTDGAVSPASLPYTTGGPSSCSSLYEYHNSALILHGSIDSALIFKT